MSSGESWKVPGKPLAAFHALHADLSPDIPKDTPLPPLPPSKRFFGDSEECVRFRETALSAYVLALAQDPVAGRLPAAQTFLATSPDARRQRVQAQQQATLEVEQHPRLQELAGDVWLLRQEHGDGDVRVARKLQDMGDFLREHGAVEQAAVVYGRALGIREAAGEEDFETVDLLQKLAFVCDAQDDSAAAEEHLSRARELLDVLNRPAGVSEDDTSARAVCGCSTTLVSLELALRVVLFGAAVTRGSAISTMYLAVFLAACAVAPIMAFPLYHCSQSSSPQKWAAAAMAVSGAALLLQVVFRALDAQDKDIGRRGTWQVFGYTSYDGDLEGFSVVWQDVAVFAIGAAYFFALRASPSTESRICTPSRIHLASVSPVQQPAAAVAAGDPRSSSKPRTSIHGTHVSGRGRRTFGLLKLVALVALFLSAVAVPTPIALAFLILQLVFLLGYAFRPAATSLLPSVTAVRVVMALAAASLLTGSLLQVSDWDAFAVQLGVVKLPAGVDNWPYVLHYVAIAVCYVAMATLVARREPAAPGRPEPTRSVVLPSLPEHAAMALFAGLPGFAATAFVCMLWAACYPALLAFPPAAFAVLLAARHSSKRLYSHGSRAFPVLVVWAALVVTTATVMCIVAVGNDGDLFQDTSPSTSTPFDDQPRCVFGCVWVWSCRLL